MALLEPPMDDDENDEIFRRMTEDLHIEPVEMSSVVSVAVLDDLTLLDRFSEAKTRLHKLGEVVQPKTTEGHEWQSIYHACLLELKKRKMM